MAADPRRKVPSVDTLLRSEPGRRASASLGRPLLKRTIARVLDDAREAAARGVEPPPDDELLARASAHASHVASGLTPVINATGVVLHTNRPRAQPVPTRTSRSIARRAPAASAPRAPKRCSSRSPGPRTRSS